MFHCEFLKQRHIHKDKTYLEPTIIRTPTLSSVSSTSHKLQPPVFFVCKKINFMKNEGGITKKATQKTNDKKPASILSYLFCVFAFHHYL